jgi:hypothetical protein
VRLSPPIPTYEPLACWACCFLIIDTLNTDSILKLRLLVLVNRNTFTDICVCVYPMCSLIHSLYSYICVCVYSSAVNSLHLFERIRYCRPGPKYIFPSADSTFYCAWLLGLSMFTSYHAWTNSLLNSQGSVFIIVFIMSSCGICWAGLSLTGIPKSKRLPTDF